MIHSYPCHINDVIDIPHLSRQSFSLLTHVSYLKNVNQRTSSMLCCLLCFYWLTVTLWHLLFVIESVDSCHQPCILFCLDRIWTGFFTFFLSTFALKDASHWHGRLARSCACRPYVELGTFRWKPGRSKAWSGSHLQSERFSFNWEVECWGRMDGWRPTDPRRGYLAFW